MCVGKYETFHSTTSSFFLSPSSLYLSPHTLSLSLTPGVSQDEALNEVIPGQKMGGSKVQPLRFLFFLSSFFLFLIFLTVFFFISIFFCMHTFIFLPIRFSVPSLHCTITVISRMLYLIILSCLSSIQSRQRVEIVCSILTRVIVMTTRRCASKFHKFNV
jgi:hypothetical protein